MLQRLVAGWQLRRPLCRRRGFNGNQQICTWRTFLGGHQYSSSFPTFLGNALGDGAVPWIWRYAAGRVLEGIGSGLGAAQTRHLITEYRAKQALVDFGVWKNAVLALLNAHFGQSIGAEWQPSWMNPPVWTATPYAKTTNNSGLLTPDATTLPGWSGANQIPLTVSGSSVTVNFEPIGANMTCQLVYRTTTGVPVYSTPVSSGACTLNFTKGAPANNVVIAVITNTDYLYAGETTRKAHYDYRLRLVTGVTGTASVNTKWYNSATLSSAREEANGKEGMVGIDWSKYCNHDAPVPRIGGELNNLVKMQLYPNPAPLNNKVTLDFIGTGNEKTTITLYTLQGAKVLETRTTGMRYVIEPKFLRPGTYLVKIKNSKTDQTQKLIVQ